MYGYNCGVVRRSCSCTPPPPTCVCPPGPPGPPGPPAPTRPFLSSYLEGLGNAQTVPFDASISFDEFDIVGPDITVDSAGDTFTIHRPGLYLVEWSINLTDENTSPAVVGLLEEGEVDSGMSSSAIVGNMSSGALINVETVPYTFELHNFGGPLVIGPVGGNINASASIRILRFADGPLG